MDLRFQSETFAPAEDQEWLGSAHGTEATETVTLDASAFIGTFTDGIIPSGVVIGRITGTDLFGPVAGGGTDGAEGHLFTTQDTKGGEVDTPAAMLTHGKVKVDNLPADHGLDTNNTVAGVRYIGTVPAAA